jgi:hypothetical protein|tara:strand:+ start:429 stop:857 length:429 start_codon:yes stop_codon:yes gene_type:complete
MKINGWLIAAAFLVGVTFAWNRFWDYVIYLMESGVSIEPLMNTTTLVVGGLGLGILALALVVVIRSEKERPTSTRERTGFLAVQLIAAIVCYLQWLWIRIPEEAGSPTLAAMSFMGWAIVAMPTWFAIGIIGIHYLSRMERT